MDDLRQRHERERDSDYLGFIAQLPCVACLVHGIHKRGVHVAHVRFADAAAGWRSVGMQEKPDDARTLPLCPPHHTGDARRVKMTQHAMSEREFYERLGLDAPALCADLHAAFRGGSSGRAVIARHAAAGRATLAGRVA